jgi:hypothetical protein
MSEVDEWCPTALDACRGEKCEECYVEESVGGRGSGALVLGPLFEGG